jgi:hypothetical protein
MVEMVEMADMVPAISCHFGIHNILEFEPPIFNGIGMYLQHFGARTVYVGIFLHLGFI